MKRNILEIFIIVLFSISFALFYNWIDPKGISIFDKTEIEVLADDDELFGYINSETNITNPDNDNLDSHQVEDEISEDIHRKSNNKEKEETDDVAVNSGNQSSTDEKQTIHKNGIEAKAVDYNQMKRIANNSDFIIIDARTPEQYKENKIGNAINIFPYGDDQNAIIESIFDLPTDKRIVIYCDGGNCDSSHMLSEMIMQLGYDKVYLYPGGWEEWASKR